MRVSGFTLAGLALGAGQACAKTIQIQVGKGGAFAFSPDSVTADKGDMLEFHFNPLNHSVVMGDFDTPCQPAKTGGFFSGFMPVSSGVSSTTFQVEVNSTDPIFFYCSQTELSHCKSGMSGAVNPTAKQSIAAYQKASGSSATAGSPDAPFGGTIVDASSPSGTSSASPSASSAAGGGGGSGGGGGKTGAAGHAQASIAAIASVAVGVAVMLLG